MALPTYEELMRPVLEVLSASRQMHVKELRDAVAQKCNLAETDLALVHETSGQNIFANRVGWACTYLKKGGFLTSPKRGVIEITESGLNLNKQNINVNLDYLLNSSDSFQEFFKPKAQASLQLSNNNTVVPLERQNDNTKKTPEEIIESQAKILTKALSEELIEKIIALSPAFFERLTVDLLLAMGYGGSHKKAAARLGKTGDGGVDGVINEDMLGLDVVYIQAKRYQPSNKVPVAAVRDFAGSLEAFKASKGVFITTSDFTPDSYDFVGKISKRIILINGTELASLLIDKGVGVRLESRYDIMKIDEGYFEE